MSTKPVLVWVQTDDDLWRTVCGRYVIMRIALPETPVKHEYQLRKVDPAMAGAYPTRGTLGYHVDSSPWHTLTENHVHSAEAEAERDAWRDAQGARRDVPEDLPAIALARFFWPISDGTSRAALALVEEDGRRYARVVGMNRRTDTYEPEVWVQIDLDAGVVSDVD